MGRIIKDGPLAVYIEREGETVVVRIGGELDLHQADALVLELDELRGNKPVVVDLSDLHFIDSTALATLIRVTDSHGFKLRGVRGQVKRLFSLIGWLSARHPKPA
jgi:anti-anti-sigma factor